MLDRVYFIAEAGVNHEGCLDTAFSLIDIAAKAGADAVKFQTFKAEKLASPTVSKVSYQIKNTKKSGSQLDMLRTLELSELEHEELFKHAEQRGIEFLSSPFDLQSMKFLIELGVKKIKIASGELFNGPLIWQATKFGVPLIISTGMSEVNDIKRCLSYVCHALEHNTFPGSLAELEEAFIRNIDQLRNEQRVVLLHCNSMYPTPVSDVNLLAMNGMAKEFALPVGYSDHTLGDEVGVAAVSLGARIIEKHFTLDRSKEGPDHLVSLEPSDLEVMIKKIRNVEKALGSEAKHPTKLETEQKKSIVQRIIAAKPIRKGAKIEAHMLATTRSTVGAPVDRIFTVIGSASKQNYEVGEPLDEIETK